MTGQEMTLLLLRRYSVRKGIDRLRRTYGSKLDIAEFDRRGISPVQIADALGDGVHRAVFAAIEQKLGRKLEEGINPYKAIDHVDQDPELDITPALIEYFKESLINPIFA